MRHRTRPRCPSHHAQSPTTARSPLRPPPLALFVEQEDQLRIMVMKKGYLINEVFDELQEMLKVVESLDGIDFAVDKQYGYVTSCPSNLGTGMRASVHVKLPNLTKDGTDKGAKAVAVRAARSRSRPRTSPSRRHLSRSLLSWPGGRALSGCRCAARAASTRRSALTAPSTSRRALACSSRRPRSSKRCTKGSPRSSTLRRQGRLSEART